MFHIERDIYTSKEGHNERVRFLVLHYTAIDFKKSVAALTGKNVSAHYLIPDLRDETYTNDGFTEMNIFSLVPEHKRAWHAGVSSWKNRTNLNDSSIGIEIVNTGERPGQEQQDYCPQQIEAVKYLCRKILAKYPDIKPTNVVGHSDISVGRKVDPGSKFPWKHLHQYGIGAWYDEETKIKYEKDLTTAASLPPSKEELIQKFKTYGYATEKAQDANYYHSLITSFQMHFRPEKVTGEADAETCAILYALVDKYY